MIIQIDDWKFDIDMTSTMEYSSGELAEHCDCAYCRNFYAAVDQVYPELRPFLAQFGVEIEAPDELMPYDFNAEMCYYGIYSVSGTILNCGISRLHAGQYPVNIAKDIELHVNSDCPTPSFFIEIGPLYLPWILDEPMKDVVSPANLPSFLKKMWDNLLKRQPSQEIQS